MRRTLRLAAAVALAGAVAWAPGGAGAADLVDSGWWWSLQSGQLATLPPPPGVEPGQLLVQGGPDGASAVAAVRYQLDETETAPVLTLRFPEGAGESAAAAVVLACPATTPWRSGSAQPWSEKPVPDCSRQAIGALADDGATMAFDLSSFVVEPVVDVVLVPGTVEGAPEGLDGSTFTLVFEQPADADLATRSAGSPITPGGSPAPAGSGAPFTPPATTGGGSGAGGSTGFAATPTFTPPALPVPPALPPSEVAAPRGTGGTGAGAVPALEPTSTDAGDARTVAVVLLVAAIAATLLGGRREALLRLLGGVPASQAAVAGVGRFARAREGAPPTLR